MRNDTATLQFRKDCKTNSKVCTVKLIFFIFLRLRGLRLFIENILKKTCVSFLKEFGWKRTEFKIQLNLKLFKIIIRFLKKQNTSNKLSKNLFSYNTSSEL